VPKVFVVLHDLLGCHFGIGDISFQSIPAFVLIEFFIINLHLNVAFYSKVFVVALVVDIGLGELSVLYPRLFIRKRLLLISG
jgi:hypothetical protein